MDFLKPAVGAIMTLFCAAWFCLLIGDYIGWVRDTPRIWKRSTATSRILLIGVLCMHATITLLLLTGIVTGVIIVVRSF